MTKNKHPIALWNPFWSVIWAVIFTPVFGAFIQRINWNEMGDAGRAAISGLWVKGSLFYLLAYLFAEPWLPEGDFSAWYFPASYALFYILWVFLSGKEQIKAVRDRFGSDYYHRLWGRPLMMGAAGLVLWMAISVTYVIALIFAGILDPASVAG